MKYSKNILCKATFFIFNIIVIGSPPIHSSHMSIQAQSLPATAVEDNVQSEGVDSDHFSGSNSSFLANEKLMSVDSMNSDITGMTFIPQFLNYIPVSCSVHCYILYT